MRKIFSYVFIDEIQDFAGYDLEVIKKLHEVGCQMILVGDPRQTTYRTHCETKYKKYSGGKIMNFVQDNIYGIEIDASTLNVSYRNNLPLLVLKHGSPLYGCLLYTSDAADD